MRKIAQQMTLAGFLLTGGVLAGCAQNPAPVVGGYGQKPALEPMVSSAPSGVSPGPNSGLVGTWTGGPASNQIEPASGPAPASIPSSSDAVPPAVQSEELPSKNGISARQPAAKVEAVTLAKPSTLNDIASPSTGSSGWKSYTVQTGDTAYRLARQFDTSTGAILKANNLTSEADVAPGQTLLIPAGVGRFASAETALQKLGPVPGHSEESVQTTMPAVAAPQRGPSALSAVDAATAQVDATAKGGRAGAPTKSVVMGPNGTRYSVAGKPGEPAAVTGETAVEPAAGPEMKSGQPVTKSDGVTYLEHRVESGETVYRIARTYQASVIDIMNANDFNQPQDLKSGMMVKVPVPAGKTAATVASGQPLVLKEQAEEDVAAVTGASAEEISSKRMAELRGTIDREAAKVKGFVWPVKGQVTSEFGAQGPGVNNTGISIKVPSNTPVLAADDGVVVYSDKGLRTYGNLVLLRHDNGLVTAYAHNNALLVQKGEKVKKGQTIALSGATGNVKEPQVHFEVRQNARAVNPMTVLSSR